MLNEQTIATLNALKLFGMARRFQERLNNPKHAELSHAELGGSTLLASAFTPER